MAIEAPRPRRKKQLVYKIVTVPGNFQQACDEFNGGLFFETHETLEELWQQERGPVRNLYKGLIQVAVAYVHISRNNHFGAGRLFRTALGYLAPYRAEGAMGWDVNHIMSVAEQAHAVVNQLGKGNLEGFDFSLRPFYAFDETALASEAQRWDAWGFDAEGSPLEMEIAVIE